VLTWWQVYPVFVIDPWFAGPEKVGLVRYRFLLQSLEDLDSSLKKVPFFFTLHRD
jgi:cryptochrome